MLGTLVNVLAIVIGSLAGRFVIPSLPERMSRTVTSGVALAVILIGMQMALTAQNVLIVILSLAMGGALGEAMDIQRGLDALGDRLKATVSDTSRFGEAFVTATLLYCVGPMAIMGAIQSGVQGDHSTLYAKSMLDGITSVVLASTVGIGVIVSAVPVLVYQGGIALAGGRLAAVLTPEMVGELTACGGLIIVALGLNMLEVTALRVANLLPALVCAPVLVVAWRFIPSLF